MKIVKNLMGLLLAYMLLTTSLYSCKKSDPEPEPSQSTVKLGAILDITGPYSEEGIAARATLEIGLADLNRQYELIGSETRFSISYLDGAMDTITALDAAKQLYGSGIRMIVAGPNISAELKAIKPWLDANKMLVLNCFSTTPALAIPDDYIFRMIPDDNVQGRAMARMLKTEGIEALVPVWCTDTYGNGLSESVRQHFTSLGGAVTEGVAYVTGAVNYSTAMGQASAQVAEAISLLGTEKVAVMLISFQDAPGFFTAAAAFPELGNVRWFGCDANTKKSSVIDNTEAAIFASQVGFMAPVMAIGTASAVPEPAQALAARVKAVTGSDPDDMALSSYDALMIYAQCYNLCQKYDAVTFKTILPSVCASYNYLGITRRLNDAGDLVSSNYIFWRVEPIAGGFAWNSHATWMSDGDYMLYKIK